jgi:hypothetical protein
MALGEDLLKGGKRRDKGKPRGYSKKEISGLEGCQHEVVDGKQRDHNS